MLYSPSANLFFHKDVKYINPPKDLVEIPDDQHTAALEARSNGGSFTYDPESKSLVVKQPDQAMLEAKQQAKSWSEYQSRALAALNKTSVTIERCFENGIAFPSEWVDYRKSLRAILGAQSGDSSQPLPIQPAYPAGT